MQQLNYSIIGSQPPQADVFDEIGKGMTLGSMIKQNRWANQDRQFALEDRQASQQAAATAKQRQAAIDAQNKQKFDAELQNLKDTHSENINKLAKMEVDFHNEKDKQLANVLTGANAGNYSYRRQYAIDHELAKPEELPEQFDPRLSATILARVTSREDRWKQHEAQVKLDNEAKVIAETNRKNLAEEAEKKRAAMAQEQLERDKNAQTANQPKTFENGKPMSADSAKVLGLISSGMQGAQTFVDALNKGDANFWTTGMLGGFTNPEAKIAFEKMTEALGRLNSGGAITKDEEARFKTLLADKKMLMTAEGRKAIVDELQRFVARGQQTGNLIYGGDGWTKGFGVQPSQPSQPATQPSKIGRFTVEVE